MRWAVASMPTSACSSAASSSTSASSSSVRRRNTPVSAPASRSRDSPSPALRRSRHEASAPRPPAATAVGGAGDASSAGRDAGSAPARSTAAPERPCGRRRRRVGRRGVRGRGRRRGGGLRVGGGGLRRKKSNIDGRVAWTGGRKAAILPPRLSPVRAVPVPPTASASSAAASAAASSAFPPGADLRPTPDRVRETLFNWLGQTSTSCDARAVRGQRACCRSRRCRAAPRAAVAVDRDPARIRALTTTAETFGATGLEAHAADARAWLARDPRAVRRDLPRPAVRRGPVGLAAACLPRRASRPAGVVYAESGTPLAPAGGAADAAQRQGRARPLSSARPRGLTPRPSPDHAEVRLSRHVRPVHAAATRISCGAPRASSTSSSSAWRRAPARDPYLHARRAHRHGARGAARRSPTSRCAASRRC